MKEIWKDAPDLKGYEVSTLGRLRNKDNGKIKKLGTHKTGYKYVSVYGNFKYIHRLVGEAFIPNPKNKPQINHKNHVRDDNRVENLEWVTFSENIKKAWEFGQFDTNNHTTKLNKEKVKEIRKDLEKGVSGSNLAKKHNVSHATISGVKTGRVWSHVK